MNERTDDTDDDRGPLLAIVVGEAAGQLADQVVIHARKATRRALRAHGFRGDITAVVKRLELWHVLADELESMILAQWANRAENVAQTMRDEGLDPEDVALLGVPAGVVPS